MVRFPAEWEQCQAILMALPDEYTDWEYMLHDVHICYRNIIGQMLAHGEKVILLCHDKKQAQSIVPEHENLTFIEASFNDTWTRDYGPITVEKDDELRALDFGFNGWGLKFAANHDNLVVNHLHNHDKLFCEPQSYGRYRKELDYVLEGGSIETDGHGTLLTTTRCLCSTNRNGGLSKQQVAEQLSRRLGIDHILWLDYGYLAGDDTDSHIDTLARIAPNDTILYVGCRNVDDEHFEELLKMRAQLTMMRTAQGNPFNLVELPMAPALYDEDGNRLPSTYANYLVTPRNIFMPVYGDENLDLVACHTLRIAFPDKTVVPIDCRPLVQQHGSLHCATMQLLSFKE